MLRIKTVPRSGGEVVLKLEGWVSRDNVDLLEREGAKVEGCRVVDLTGLTSIDEAGIALFIRWSRDRLVLCTPSLFMRRLLSTYGLVCVNEIP